MPWNRGGRWIFELSGQIGGGFWGNRLLAWGKQFVFGFVVLPEESVPTLPINVPASTQVNYLAEAESENDDAMAKIAPLLSSQKILSDLQEHARRMNLSRRHLQRCLLAVAEAGFRAQDEVQEGVLSYIDAMVTAGVWLPILYQFHLEHDETPLRLQNQYTGSEQQSPQVTKVIAIEARWSVLVRSAENKNLFWQLSGTYGKALRAAENTTGETLMKVLASGPQPHTSLISKFVHRWRILETDACPANLRCERLLSASEAVWHTSALHGFCLMHACHHVAAKTWPRLGLTLTGNMWHQCCSRKLPR